MGRKKVVKKKEVASPIYENAIDSLRIGIEFFLKEDGYSSRKHAILTVFHAIELLLKERLAQTNPILTKALAAAGATVSPDGRAISKPPSRRPT